MQDTSLREHSITSVVAAGVGHYFSQPHRIGKASDSCETFPYARKGDLHRELLFSDEARGSCERNWASQGCPRRLEPRQPMRGVCPNCAAKVRIRRSRDNGAPSSVWFQDIVHTWLGSNRAPLPETTDFRASVDTYGPPASTLTDNGLVFTTRVRRGRNAFENELRLLGIDQKNGRPNHPQTQGKVERFQQTMKKWLTAQPPAATIDELQTQLDRFRNYYNQTRPHRSLNRRTPAQAYVALGKAGPAGTVDGHWRIRDDRIDQSGVVTLRYDSRLHHIGIGRIHKGTRVKILIHDRHIRILSTDTGQLLRELILDPSRDYQPQKPQNALPKESEL